MMRYRETRNIEHSEQKPFMYFLIYYFAGINQWYKIGQSWILIHPKSYHRFN